MSDYETESMVDLPLFSLAPSEPKSKTREPNTLARTSHPATSHAAAEQITASGNRAIDLRDALALVMENPGRTAGELDAIDKMPSGRGYAMKREGRIRKRLRELANSDKPKIASGPVRVCGEGGNKCQTWWPIETLQRMEKM